MEQKQKRIVGVAVAVLVAIGSVAWWQFNPIVARVGTEVIRKRDVAYQAQISAVLTNHSNPEAARDALIRGLVQAEVLKKNGFEVTEAAVRNEAVRMSFAMKPGSSLEKVRKLFGEDDADYRRIFVHRLLVERLTLELLDKAPIRETTKRKAEELAAAARKDPKSFGKLATARGLTVEKGELTRKDGMLWDSEAEARKRAVQGTGIPTPFESTSSLIVEKDREYWFNEVFGGLKDGQVRAEPLEYGRAWLVLRLVSRAPAKKGPELYKVEGIRVPMGEGHEWLKEQTEKVAVEIL